MRTTHAALLLAAWLLGCGSRPPPKDETPANVDARAVVVEAPDGLRPDARAPLVVALHGYGGEAAELVARLHLSAAARRHRFVLVAPNGSVDRDGKRFWNATDACCDFGDRKPDDVAYLDRLIEEQKARFPVDAKRVFVVGVSNGGFMAHRYACDRAANVAAIASLAGAGDDDRARCRPKEGVSVLEIRGDADAIVDYHGGFLGGGLPQRARYLGARESLDVWLRTDACKPVPDTSSPALDLDAASPDAETTIQRWADCEHGAVELWTMHGVGHRASPTPAFAERVWTFLESHPKR